MIHLFNDRLLNFNDILLKIKINEVIPCVLMQNNAHDYHVGEKVNCGELTSEPILLLKYAHKHRSFQKEKKEGRLKGERGEVKKEVRKKRDRRRLMWRSEDQWS